MVRQVAEAISPPQSELDSCLHCGLAVRAGDSYCCYGCDLAAQITRECQEDHGHLQALLTFAALLTMIVMMLSLFLYAGDIYDAGEEDGLGWLKSIYRWAAAVLSTPVLLLCGIPLLRRAWSRIREGRLSMDLLIVSGSFTAYGLSVTSVLQGGDQVYFDSATSALVLATLGRLIEARARSEASLRLAPTVELASRAVDVWESGVWVTRSPALIEAGDIIRVAMEGAVPVDAVLIAPIGAENVASEPGVAIKVEINMGILTGESVPVLCTVGDDIPAGAVVLGHELYAKARHSARDSTLERLASLAGALKDRPLHLMRLADQFASFMVPAVWALAVGTVIYWGSQGALEQGVIAALAVVLAACPCVYGVAAPLVFWLTLRKALRHEVLIRDAAALERLANVQEVVFDKTGTLTELRIGRVLWGDLPEANESDRREVMELVAAMESGSTHPVGRALADCAAEWFAAHDTEAQGLALATRQSKIGVGIEAVDSQGRTLQLGRAVANSGQGNMALTRDGAVLAAFEVEERLQGGAEQAVRLLRGAGQTSTILSGDAEARVQAIAETLSVASFAEHSPEQKVAHISEMASSNRGEVAMVGDGLNDAPALAAAGPSFAVTSGTDLARSIAQVVLLRHDLTLVPWTLDLSRRSTRLARTLLITATTYNVLFLSLAAAGMLRPVFAGISMLLSSLLSIGAALRVAAWRGPEDA